MKFNDRLKTLRDDRGFTQRQLAEVLNITVSSVSHYENGSRQPGIEVLIRMADVLNVSVDYLVGSADTNILPEEMNKQYCKGISTGELLQRAIQLDQSHRQSLSYSLKCIELEQMFSNKGRRG